MHSKRCTLWTALALLCAAMGLSGCATHRAYSGDTLPRDQVARIDLVRTEVTLNGEVVDGKRYRTVEVLPGTHSIEWTFTYPNNYREQQQLVLRAKAGRSYRMGERFIPAPHPYGPVVEAGEFLVGTAIDVALLPFTLLLPAGEADDAPEGELYVWITEAGSGEKRIVAGYAPQLPQPHPPIMAIELDDELLR